MKALKLNKLAVLLASSAVLYSSTPAIAQTATASDSADASGRDDRFHSWASGIGSELALAADMRFASREKAVLSQFEVGAGFVPGGGPMAYLPRLVGRGRALEILIGADDFNGELAELTVT